MRKVVVFLLIFVLPYSIQAHVVLARWTMRGDCHSYKPIEVYLSEDHGATWFLQGKPDSTSDQDFGLSIGESPSGNLYLVALGEGRYPPESISKGAHFYFSSDTGKIWEERTLITPNGLNDKSSAGIAVLEDSLIFVHLLGASSGNKIEVWKSTDGGFSWTNISNLDVESMDCDPEGEMTFDKDGNLYIGEWVNAESKPTVYRSTDSGSTWISAEISSDSATSNSRNCSVAMQGSTGDLYACIWSNKSNLKIYRSSDNGDSWEFVNTIVEHPSNKDGGSTIGITPDGKLYVATWEIQENTFIYTSDDNGLSWYQVGEIPGLGDPDYGRSCVISISSYLPSEAGIDESSFEEKFNLYQNTPNPFSTKTVIEFTVNSSQCTDKSCQLQIYDLTGRMVKSFPITQSPNSPIARVIWNGRNDMGKKMPAGVYFYSILTENYREIRKMTLIE